MSNPILDNPGALFLLDTLWALDTHMAVIRRRIGPMVQGDLSVHDIRDAANRYREKPVRRAPVVVPAVVEPTLEELLLNDEPLPPTWAIPFGRAGNRPPDNSVRLVKPGTYPVPAGGFKMGVFK
jgi:hypothetical protein